MSGAGRAVQARRGRISRVGATAPTGGVSGGWLGEGLAHEALVFDTEQTVVERCVPFVREGFDRDELVLVVASANVRRSLEGALGPDRARLAMVAAAETWWRGSGAATLQAYHRDLAQLAGLGRPWRLVAEPVWLDRDDGREWSRFEAVANRCYADYPYYSLCLHDRRRLSAEVLDHVRRTHPLVSDGLGPVASRQYQDAEAYLRSVEPAWSARPTQARTLSTTDPRAARQWVRETAECLGEGARSAEILLGVHELVTNAVRSAGSAQVSAWVDTGTLVFEVADSGPGLHDTLAGYVPPDAGADGGRGLWLARSLADDATVRPTGPGTALRLFFHRSPG